MHDDYRDALLGPPRPRDLAAIRARRAAITAGCWELRDRHIGDVDPDAFIEIFPIIEYWEGGLTRADAAFIAAAPADIDTLLALAARLDAAITRIEYAAAGAELGSAAYAALDTQLELLYQIRGDAP